MISNKPYLLRAFHDWIIDSKCTPIIVIDVNHPGCRIPEAYVEGHEIVFNISPSAVRDLKMTNKTLEFNATFSGLIYSISAPIESIQSIYAEENGEGIFFEAEEHAGKDGSTETSREISTSPLTSIQGSASNSVTGDASKTKGHLKLVE